MVSLFKIDAMSYTPFVKQYGIDFLKKQGITITDRKADADILLAQHYKNLIPAQIKHGHKKKYLIWCHEPRWNTSFQKTFKLFPGMPGTHIMNVYTGDIFLNNYYTMSGNSLKCIDRKLEFLSEENFPEFQHKKIVALMYYRNNRRQWSLKRDGEELDLCYLRTRIAIEGYRLGKIDIYGKDWPKGMSLENSRNEKNRKNRKSEILKSYHFNLCFENTNTDYYCTEKIWDSIANGCLPIYYGRGNRIYEDFPKESFLDYCNFKSCQEMFDFVDAMTLEEFRHRMNLCIDVYNRAYTRLSEAINEPYDRMLMEVVRKVEVIIG